MSTQWQDQAKDTAQTASTPAPKAILQRQCACGQHAEGGECADCRVKREGTLQRAAVTSTAKTGVPPVVHDVLNSPGQPLDAATREFMEPRFGQDFSQVRVHTDAKASGSAQSIQARAYTVGSDVVFGAGQYMPETDAGQRLLAHELTHVVQQGARADASTAEDLSIDASSSASEQAARQTANMVGASQHSGTGNIPGAMHASPGGSLIQREPLPGANDLKLKPPVEGTGPKPPTLSGREGSQILTIEAFELGKAHLTEKHQNDLKRLAQTILSQLPTHPNAFVSIVGHTDTVGTTERNEALSQQRASAAMAFLATQGVPQNIMHASGLGARVLRVETKKDVAEPRNRRVEVTFEPQKALPSLDVPKLSLEPPKPSLQPWKPPPIPTLGPKPPGYIPQPGVTPGPGRPSLDDQIRAAVLNGLSGAVEGADVKVASRFGVNIAVTGVTAQLKLGKVLAEAKVGIDRKVELSVTRGNMKFSVELDGQKWKLTLASPSEETPDLDKLGEIFKKGAEGLGRIASDPTAIGSAQTAGSVKDTIDNLEHIAKSISRRIEFSVGTGEDEKGSPRGVEVKMNVIILRW